MVLSDSEYIQTDLVGELYFLKEMSEAILRTNVCSG
jgi:hypothetical protein